MQQFRVGSDRPKIIRELKVTTYRISLRSLQLRLKKLGDGRHDLIDPHALQLGLRHL